MVDGVELKAFIPRAPADSTSIESVIGYSKVCARACFYVCVCVVAEMGT